MPSDNSRRKLWRAGDKRQPGGLFFGSFLLAEQKKGTRPRVRKPTFKQLSQKRLLIEPVFTENSAGWS